MDNGIDNEGDGAADNDGDNGYGATDDDVDKDGQWRRCDGQRRRQRWRDGRG